MAMSMINPNVVHVSNVFLHECYGFPSLIVYLGIHLILVIHFVWCGIEYTVLVLVIIYQYFPIKSYTMAAPELFDVSAVGSCA